MSSEATLTDTPARAGPREQMAMLAMLMALNALAIDAMLPALPDIGASLGAGAGNARQYVITAYLLGTGFGSLLHGPLADRYGRRPVVLGALAAYVVFALGCALATAFPAFLALRLAQGLAGAALGVVSIAIVRDLYAGDAMARRMSTIFLIFMAVPIIAPTLGAAIMWAGGWRSIFHVLAIAALLMAFWAHRRLGETLDPANVRALDVATVASGWAATARPLHPNLYVVGGALVQGALYGYLGSSEQIVDQVFGQKALFPLLFAAVAIGIAFSNWSNSRIVERFGARRVSQSALVVYIAVSALQCAAAVSGRETLGLFTLLMMVNIGLVGFIGSNFGAISMERFGHMAGAASAFQQFARAVLATSIGALIGQSYDGSTVPLAFAFLICGVTALAAVTLAERGKLFTRPGTAPKTPVSPR
jgi:DHA1 family bicyclomycin/chloramphenicol resistance-like MFS transporter